jgi:hypothetical protein
MGKFSLKWESFHKYGKVPIQNGKVPIKIGKFPKKWESSHKNGKVPKKMGNFLLK